jgi:ABC-type Fe3+-hydroxamate transport system substrate-binding protein
MMVGLLAVGLLVAACGADDDANPAASRPTPASTGVGVAATAATDVRTVDGADGPVEIPAHSSRIVGDLISLDYMTALGMDPDLFVGIFGATFFPADHYLADVLQRDDLVDPGFAFEANLEALAAADPDLIVAPFDQIDGAPGLDAMREIAPVLIVPTSDTRDPRARYGGTASFQDWRSTLRRYGAAFQLEDEAEAYIAATDAAITTLRTDHGALVDETTVTEMKSTPGFAAVNVLSAAQDAGVLGTILLSELGFQTPPAQMAAIIDEYGSIELSEENLGLVDADLLFVEVREGDRTFEDNPLWPTLSVVQRGHVHEVGNHWEYGGAVAARVVLDDVRSALDQLATAR